MSIREAYDALGVRLHGHPAAPCRLHPQLGYPYGGVLLDLNVGPLVVELPPGPLLGAVLDISQRWVADVVLPGPDAGKGGKHLLLPPGHAAAVPSGYHVGRATSFRVVVGVRSLPEKPTSRAASRG